MYNRAEMVKATLESVRRQTHRPLHLVLVDNNSSDDSLQVLQDFKKENETSDFKIDVLEEKKQGASIARNTGATVARADWLMFFDSDDTMDDCLVEKYVEKIIQNDVDLVCTTADYNYKGKNVRSFLAYDNFMINHIFHTCLSTVRYIVRRSLFECAGCWNESLSYWDDWELGVRLLLEKPKVAVVDDGIYVHVYAHDDSITGNLYSTRIVEAKKAISAAETAVICSGHEKITVLLNYIRYKKVLLAGLCKKEGRTDISQELMKGVNYELKGNYKLKLLYNILYKYVGWGGRGSQRIVKHLVR